jgi:hypothetical protein
MLTSKISALARDGMPLAGQAELCSVLLCVYGAKGPDASFEVGGAVPREEGSQFCINAVIRPGFGNANDAGGVFPKEWAEVFDVFCENDAALGDSECIDGRIGQAGEIEIVLDVFDIKAFIEPRKKTGGVRLAHQEASYV